MRLADVKTVTSLGVWQPSQLDYETIRQEFRKVLRDAGLHSPYGEVRDPTAVLETYVAGVRYTALDPYDVNVSTFHHDNCHCSYRTWNGRDRCRNSVNANYYLVMWSNILPTEVRPFQTFQDGAVLLFNNAGAWHRSPKIVPGTQRWFVRVCDVKEA